MALLLQAGCVWSVVGTCINEPLEMMRMGCVPSFPHPLQSTLSCMLPSGCAQISPVFCEKQISSESTFRMVLISGQSLYLLSPLATGGSILPSVAAESWLKASWLSPVHSVWLQGNSGCLSVTLGGGFFCYNHQSSQIFSSILYFWDIFVCASCWVSHSSTCALPLEC